MIGGVVLALAAAAAVAAGSNSETSEVQHPHTTLPLPSSKEKQNQGGMREYLKDLFSIPPLWILLPFHQGSSTAPAATMAASGGVSAGASSEAGREERIKDRQVSACFS